MKNSQRKNSISFFYIIKVDQLVLLTALLKKKMLSINGKLRNQVTIT